MSNRTEDESKVDIGEAFVSFECIKEELKEEVINIEENNHPKQYEMNEYKNTIFSSASSKGEVGNRDNLIDHLDVIMEHEFIKVEDIKEENRNTHDSHCTKCTGDYKGHCLKCSTLSHILNNTVPITNPKSKLNDIPTDILEIRETLMGKGVFLLRTLPKKVIFGPFEGISGIESTVGYSWKIRDRQLVNIKNGNWMKYVCAINDLLKNLDIFQIEGSLYFQTNREIVEGEELLVYYNDKEIHTSNNSQECYVVPQKQDKSPKIFACTLCCLGFSSDKCLIEHKSICPRAEQNKDTKDLELVECQHCKIWLDNQEYEDYHIAYCGRTVDRMSADCTKSGVKKETNEDNVDLTEFSDDELYRNNSDIDKLLLQEVNLQIEQYQCNICRMKFDSTSSLAVHKKNKHMQYKCSECFYETSRKYNLKIHLHTHTDKQFQCGICLMKFTQKYGLKIHIKNQHPKPGTDKDYKCSKCFYQTNNKRDMTVHVNNHDDVKPFECDICFMKFTRKKSVKSHKRDKHSEGEIVKDFKCTECSYETNYKRSLMEHLNTHTDIKPFQCDICMMKFTRKSSLKTHTINKHTENVIENKHKCSDCHYETNYKHDLIIHSGTHTNIKPFECDTCMMKFIKKDSLEKHIKNKHAETGSSKDYQCAECSFETNHRSSLKLHLNKHRDVMLYQCDICQTKFKTKYYLKRHIKNKHARNETDKEYKCSDCSFQTNYKDSLQRHLITHGDVKPFQCHICVKQCAKEVNFKTHIKNKHTNQ